MGLAVVAMTINLVQEEIIERFRQLAIDIGIIDDDEDILDDEVWNNDFELINIWNLIETNMLICDIQNMENILFQPFE